jgi:hypothetical protein
VVEDLGLAGIVRCLELDVSVKRFDVVVVGESVVVFWLFNELLDELTEFCRDKPGDEDLDEG